MFSTRIFLVAALALSPLALYATQASAQPVNVSLGAAYTASVDPAASWPDTGGALTDGTIGQAQFSSQWQGRDAAGDYQITLDLGGSNQVDSVATHWLYDSASYVFLPPSVTVAFSEDATTFTPAELLTVPPNPTGTAVVNIGADDLDFTARYVRFTIDGGTAWTMISEIEVLGVPDAPASNRCERQPRFSGTFIQPDLIAQWSDQQLQEAVDTLHEACIDTQILQWTADTRAGTVISDLPVNGLTYSETTDLIGRLLDAQDQAGGSVIIGLQNNHDFFDVAASDPAWLADEADTAVELASAIVDEYGDHPAFAGWYLPFEMDNLGFPTQLEWDRMADFYDTVTDELELITPGMPVAIAPFYNDGLAGALDPAGWQAMWTHILGRTDIDILALQDGVGAGHVTHQRLPAWFSATRDAITAAGSNTELYADTETFIFGPSGLQPMATGDFVTAMIAVQPYVADYWAFAYDHYQSPVATGNNADHTGYLLYLDTGVVDAEPPTTPQALTAVPTDARSVELSWDAATDDIGIASYLIHRGGVHVATVPAGQTELRDVMLSPQTVYEYQVAAVDAAGNTSALSQSVTVQTATAPVYDSLWSHAMGYTSSVPAASNHPDHAGNSLTDGVRGGLAYGTNWQGRNAPGSYSFTIDLEQMRHIGSVASGWLQIRGDYVFLPPALRIEVSSDGEVFTPLADVGRVAADPSDQVHEYVFDGLDVNARYVRLIVDGGTAWTMIDEIQVRGDASPSPVNGSDTNDNDGIGTNIGTGAGNGGVLNGSEPGSIANNRSGAPATAAMPVTLPATGLHWSLPAGMTALMLIAVGWSSRQGATRLASQV